MRLRWSQVGSLLALVAIAVAGLVVILPAIQRRLDYGTFSTEGPPLRIDYCGRRYYPDPDFPSSAYVTASAVATFLSENGQVGLTRIGTTPSRMPIVANVMTAAQRASFHTSVCTMALWVEAGPDRYLPYSLSGGP